MTTKRRRVLYVLAFAVFCAAAPAALYYADGYRLDIRNFRLIKTLSISVDSFPRGAAVFLDGERRGTSPVVLSGLYPSRYKLTLQRGGYSDWSDVVDLNTQSDARVARLAPAISIKKMLDIDGFWGPGAVSATGQAAFVETQNSDAGQFLRLVQPDNSLSSESLQIGQSPVRSVVWSPAGSRLAVITDQTVWLIGIDDSGFRFLRSLDALPSAEYRWVNESEMLVRENGSVRTVLAEPESEPRERILENVRDIQVSDQGFVALFSDRPNEATILDQSFVAKASVTIPEATERIVAVFDQLIVVSGKYQSYILDLSSGQTVAAEIGNVSHVERLAASKKFLVSSGEETRLVDVESGKSALLARQTPILGAIPVGEDGPVLIIGNTTLRAVDPDTLTASVGTWNFSVPVSSAFVHVNRIFLISGGGLVILEAGS